MELAGSDRKMAAIWEAAPDGFRGALYRRGALLALVAVYLGHRDDVAISTSDFATCCRFIR